MPRSLRLLVLLCGLQALSCGGKSRSDAPPPEGSSGATSGGAPSSIPAEQHLLIAKAGLRATNPDAAWSADRLGVVYLIEAGNSRQSIGLSISRSQSIARDGFDQTVLGEPAMRRSPRIAGLSDGYALVWLEAGQALEALMLQRVDRSGQPQAEARELARPDAVQFSIASSERTLAVATHERVEDSWHVSITLESDSTVLAPLALDSCSQPSSAPAVVWDGAAFDVVYVCAEAAPAAPQLKLARVSESGELLGLPRVLDARPTATHCPSLGLSFDRGALSLLYASQAEPETSVSFVRVDPERATLREARSLQGSLFPGRLSIAPTPTGYQVLSTGCATQSASSVAVTLCALDTSGAPGEACLRMPTSSSVPRPSTVVAAPEGSLFVYDEGLLGSAHGVFVVDLATAPSSPFSATSVVSPVGEFSPHSLACSGRACRLQGFRGRAASARFPRALANTTRSAT